MPVGRNTASAASGDGQHDRGAKVTIEQVAQIAGVSTATVSRVINGHPDVSSATRSEVLRHARELGYVNLRASSLDSTNRLGLVALSVADIREPRIGEVVTGAASALRERRARLVVCPPAENGSESLRERLLEGTTNGAIIIQPRDEVLQLMELKRQHFPFVVVEPTMPLDSSLTAVMISSWAGAKMATDYLVGLGHIHIGLITGPSDWRVTADRLAGYQAALLTAGLPLVPHLVRESDLTLEGGQTETAKLLGLPNPPSAVFALSDGMAVGALKAVRNRGSEVPRDISVVGFGDSEIASVTTPPLTTVHEPLQGLGRVAADMIWKLMQGQQLDAPRMELSTTLAIRDSTGRPRGTSFLTM